MLIIVFRWRCLLLLGNWRLVLVVWCLVSGVSCFSSVLCTACVLRLAFAVCLFVVCCSLLRVCCWLFFFSCCMLVVGCWLLLFFDVRLLVVGLLPAIG